MQFQDDYFAAYRSLRLTRDADGVLVVEFHSKGGPFRFTAQDHTEFVDASYRIGQDRENILARSLLHNMQYWSRWLHFKLLR
jgi:hypothetical protein